MAEAGWDCVLEGCAWEDCVLPGFYEKMWDWDFSWSSNLEERSPPLEMETAWIGPEARQAWSLWTISNASLI
jgi:hypothetical protein